MKIKDVYDALAMEIERSIREYKIPARIEDREGHLCWVTENSEPQSSVVELGIWGSSEDTQITVDVRHRQGITCKATSETFTVNEALISGIEKLVEKLRIALSSCFATDAYLARELVQALATLLPGYELDAHRMKSILKLAIYEG